jgi:UDP-N-acetylmuramoylalanine--D-glutamate ligase
MPNANIIAITGTNGKTTTTALIAHLLTSIGLDAVAAGNIGTPLSTFALRPVPPKWFSVEMSSFQLHDTPNLRPLVGVLTNLTPDHLDRYESVDAYYADKQLLFANAAPESKWVWNADSDAVRSMASRVKGRHATFSVAASDAEAWYDRESDMLVVGDEPILARNDLPLIGDHNVANALAAALAVSVADDLHRASGMTQKLAEGLKTFHALPHRREVVGEYAGVQWINDSKATNVDSTRVAVAGMTRRRGVRDRWARSHRGR